jgi:hypothetical protein
MVDKHGDKLEPDDLIVIKKVVGNRTAYVLYKVLQFDKAIPDPKSDPIFKPVCLSQVSADDITKL